MKVILSHPTGNQNVRAVVSALNEAGLLHRFLTTIASFPGSYLDTLGGLKPFAEMRKRNYDPELRSRTSLWPWLELPRLMAKKFGFEKLTAHETGVFSMDAVYHAQDRRAASLLKAGGKEKVRGVYAYEDGARFSFEEAGKLGIRRLYDLPIGYWRAARMLLRHESERWPEWAATLNTLKDSEAKLARKDKEIELADCIFVASSFTAETLKAYPGKLPPVRVIPYGFPPAGSLKSYTFHQAERPLKLLFVGGLSQRKGIADLFFVAEQLGAKVELTVVGRSNTGDCPALSSALAKHRWIPSLSHAQVLEAMREADVLVFPSLFEGFGLVITEAMSQGTPVITTERTVGPDIISHGENGWLIRAGSVDDLQQTIEGILREPSVVESAGRKARETAAGRPWDVYEQEMTEAIGALLK